MGTWVVTGASSGIGRATAAALSDGGATVIAAARREHALDELATAHAGVRPVVADLATNEGVDALTEAALGYGSLDGIVHGAGSLVHVEPYLELASADLSRHMHLHVAVPIELNQRLADSLVGGRIVYIDSLSASAPRVGWSAYSIVKAAAQMAARAAHEELDDVDVVRLFPGGVRTPLVEAVLDAPASSPVSEAFRGFDAAGEIAEPDAIGVWVASIALGATRAELATTDAWTYTAGGPTGSGDR